MGFSGTTGAKKGLSRGCQPTGDRDHSIVFALAVDPVASGLVASLARPVSPRPRVLPRPGTPLAFIQANELNPPKAALRRLQSGEDIMPKYLLVSFKTCPWVQRAAIVLREKNVPFEFRHIEPDNRPDWFLAISPHKKVPVLRVDDTVSLFESNAINEYLDETVAPRLHPDDPIARAVNRAWTDYVPTFAETVTGMAYADGEAGYRTCVEKIPVAFERVERALEKQGNGPLFNGANYSLVDAAYAPFLQRYVFLDRIRPIGLIAKYPRLSAWADTLMKRPSTHSFPEIEFEAMYRMNVKRRNKWLSQFIPDVAVAAE
jgi:glutathione S-transferase